MLAKELCQNDYLIDVGLVPFLIVFFGDEEFRENA